jgi:hypothetical protein
MSFLQPSFGRLVNFTASLRKNFLIPSGFFSPNQDTSWIWSPSSQTSTTPITPTGSPFTYTAGSASESVYISGGAVTSITINGQALTVALPITVPLQPGESVTVTYTLAPTMVTDIGA